MTLRLDQVRRIVGDEVWIDTLSLDLAAGQLYVLLGPTLAGKTSLMRLMAGLDQPTSGRILVDGVDVTGMSVRQRSVAMVYQQFINYPTLTAYDNIASPLRLQGTPKAELDRQVRDTARMLHIDHLLDRLPAALSGGQQQRLAIARALVKKAKLLLLDEPLVNLDYKLREELRAELRDLFARQQTTVVYATTEPLEALIMGGEVIVMDEGRVLQTGPTVEVYHRPGSLRVAAVYSDPPMNMLAVTVADGVARGRSGLELPLTRHLAGLGDRAAHAGRAGEPPVDAPPRRRRHRDRRHGGAGRDLGLGDLRPRPQRRPALGGAGGGRARACAGAAGAGPSRSRAALRLRSRRGAGAGARAPWRAEAERRAMARIDFEAVAHSYAAARKRAAGLRAEAAAVRVRGRRRLCAARAVGLRQDHAAQHHLGPAAAERGPGAVRSARRDPADPGAAQHRPGVPVPGDLRHHDRGREPRLPAAQPWHPGAARSPSASPRSRRCSTSSR